MKASPPAMQLFANLSFPVIISQREKWINKSKITTMGDLWEIVH